MTAFDRLIADPSAFDPATALRIAADHGEQHGQPVIITSVPTSAQANTAITTVRTTPKGIEVSAVIMGLTGPLSPLPNQYTELAARDRRRKAGALSAFLDLFSDRLTQLFLAATEKYNLGAQLRWADPSKRPIVQALRALIGFGTPGLPEKMPLPDDTLLRHAGLLAQRTRSAEGLRALLASDLGLPVRVVQFHALWRDVAPADQSRMNGLAQVGSTAMAGAKVPDRAGQCRIIIGPLRYPDFLTLERGQTRVRRLCDLIRLYLGPVIGFDLQIVLDQRDVPITQLGGDGPAAQLGWNSWARHEPAARDSDDAIIRPQC
jgi:type VI secretion system protein ImpH